MQLSSAEKKKLEGIGKKHDLRLILVYGSYAKGTQNKLSDLDIACLARKSFGFDETMSLYSDFSSLFGDIERELDVVILNKKDPLFLYQVSKGAELLYGDMVDFQEFKAFAFRNYMDSKDLRELEKKLVLKAQKQLSGAYAR